MTDRPMIFSGPMVRAILEGRKTQTRRVLEPQPEHRQHYVWKGRVIHDSEYRHWCWKGNVGFDNWDSITIQLRPHLPVKVGDCIWVKETWFLGKGHDDAPPRSAPPHSRVWYKEDPSRDNCDAIGKVRSARFMCKWASRLTLTVTDVRVQRVQEISEEDAEAEGAAHCPVCNDVGWINSGPDGGYECDVPGCSDSYGYHFRCLWDELNAKRGFGWEANPWVAAYTFTVEPKNIDTPTEKA